MEMCRIMVDRIWRGGLYDKSIAILNIVIIFLVKGSNTLVPLALKEVVDAMVCDESALPSDSSFFLNSSEGGCPEESDVYLMIFIYIFLKFLSQFFFYIREVPFATMSASAELSISNEVFNHVQSQSLAFHLNRATGKVITIVSRGASQFTAIVRLLNFNLIPLTVELLMVLLVFATLFSYAFMLV